MTENDKAVEKSEQLDLEPIGNLVYDGKTVQARVVSNGCTSSDHFRVDYSLVDGHCHAVIVRTKPDFCRKTPEGVDITIEWPMPAECTDLSVVLFLNPPFTEPVKRLGKSMPSGKSQ